MASCSRDSTVRLWSLTPLISPLLLNIVTEQPWDRILGNTGEPGWGQGGLLSVCPSQSLYVSIVPRVRYSIFRDELQP